MKLIFPVAGFLLLCLSACFDNSDCGSVNTSFLSIGFFDLRTGNTLPVFFDSVYTPDQVVLADPQGTQAQILLPLDPESDAITLVFRRQQQLDTISLTYERVLNLIHPDCRGEIVYNNLQVVETTFTSFLITARNVRRINETNLEIYF